MSSRAMYPQPWDGLIGNAINDAHLAADERRSCRRDRDAPEPHRPLSAPAAPATAAVPPARVWVPGRRLVGAVS